MWTNQFVKMNVLPAQPVGIQSTAGAVPIRNEKGESCPSLYMLITNFSGINQIEIAHCYLPLYAYFTKCFLFTGEISMQKVKVQRYISGKKPDYAQGASSTEESDNEDFIEQQKPDRRQQTLPQVISKKEEHQSDEEKEVSVPCGFI